ncbi:MAG: hypothetical protein IJU39_03270 [Clostridia bacterium]|nr:hypothetical protein [Clostridia bacterium]
MAGSRRTFAVLTLAAFVLVILLSSCFMVFCSHHDCDGDGCFVCRFINECVANRFKVSATVLFCFLFIAAALSAIVSAGSSFLSFSDHTPVSLCDKMSC